MPDFSDQTTKLRVLWNKARNMYSAFYTELSEARREIGDEKFADWCFSDLRISLSILNETARVLKSADAGVVKAELARAAKASKEVKAQERRAAQEERARLAEEKKRQQAEDDEERQRVALSAKRKQRRENKKAAVRQALPAGSDELARLLAECASIEKTSRIELGRCYAAMKEIVQTQRAGKNEDDKHWTWGEWSAAYIRRSQRDIDRCILEFQTSCLNKQENNVVPITKNVA